MHSVICFPKTKWLRCQRRQCIFSAQLRHCLHTKHQAELPTAAHISLVLQLFINHSPNSQTLIGLKRTKKGPTRTKQRCPFGVVLFLLIQHDLWGFNRYQFHLAHLGFISPPYFLYSNPFKSPQLARGCFFSLLLCRGEPHAVCVPVKHAVVASNEHISEDPQRSSRRRDVHCHEA